MRYCYNKVTLKVLHINVTMHHVVRLSRCESKRKQKVNLILIIQNLKQQMLTVSQHAVLSGFPL